MKLLFLIIGGISALLSAPSGTLTETGATTTVTTLPSQQEVVQQAAETPQTDVATSSLSSSQKETLRKAEDLTGANTEDKAYIKSLFSTLDDSRKDEAVLAVVSLLAIEHMDRGYILGEYDKELFGDEGKARLRQDAEVFSKALLSLHKNNVDGTFTSLADSIVAADRAIEKNTGKNHSIENYARYVNASTENGNIIGGMTNEEFLALSATLYPDEPGWDHNK